MKPLVSVVIPTYNRSILLDQTLRTLALQVLETNEMEVLVVDDGSSDDTEQVVRSHAGSLRISYFFQEDLGYRVATARNVGIRNAQGDVVIMVDSGMILSPRTVQAHLDAHRQSPGPLAVVAPALGLTAEPTSFIGLDFVSRHDLDALFERLCAMPELEDIRCQSSFFCEAAFSRAPAPWAFFWTCNVSVTRAALARIGGFDERYQSWGMEDVDLGYRLHRAGLPFALAPGGAALHHPHPRSDHENDQSDEKNTRFFVETHLELAADYYYCGRGVMFNDELAHVWERDADRHLDALPEGEQLGVWLRDAVGDGRVVLVGGGPALARGLGAEVVLEHTPERFSAIEREGPCRALRRLGGVTEFAAGSFASALISDVWTVLPVHWLERLFREACRIAQYAWLLGRVQNETGDVLAGPTDEQAHLLRRVSHEPTRVIVRDGWRLELIRLGSP